MDPIFGGFPKAYRIEKEIAGDGVLQLDALPFQAGERVEVIILKREQTLETHSQSVRGKVLEYIDPTLPIAGNDWR